MSYMHEECGSLSITFRWSLFSYTGEISIPGNKKLKGYGSTCEEYVLV